jgi:hypothetical protein
MKTIPVIDATAPGAVIGRHAIWLPEMQLKIPFQFSGQITKYQHTERGYRPADTIPHELAILRALAAERMAPPVDEVVFIETLISEHPGAWHADPLGAWAYRMADANLLPPGRFSIERMRQLPIAGSNGAWGDVAKPGNVVNGYLVDVRRSAWDMLRWAGLDLPRLPALLNNVDKLRARVHRDCQFPAGARAEAYQDFWLFGKLERGQRRVAERAVEMGFTPRPGESVLDIGTQAGGFLQFAARSGATRLAGVEMEPRYIDCARELARSSRQNICIRQMDVVRERAGFINWVRAYFPRGVDHCLALSLEKHIGERFLFDLLDEIGARRSYVETNAVPNEQHLKMHDYVQARGGRHVGFSRDRNLRVLYQIGAP